MPIDLSMSITIRLPPITPFNGTANDALKISGSKQRMEMGQQARGFWAANNTHKSQRTDALSTPVASACPRWFRLSTIHGRDSAKDHNAPECHSR